MRWDEMYSAHLFSHPIKPVDFRDNRVPVWSSHIGTNLCRFHAYQNELTGTQKKVMRLLSEEEMRVYV